MIRLFFEDEQHLLSESNKSLMNRCALAAVQTEGIAHLPLSAYVRITDDAEIHSINLMHRSKDASTDVLSFPSVEYLPGKTARHSVKRICLEYDPDTRAYFLGDVIISMDHVKVQAEEYGHSTERELGYLLTHALFHLMGYDHIEDKDRVHMRAHEKMALNSIGLIREEETNMSDEELIALAFEAREMAYVPYSNYKVGAALLSEDGQVFKGCNVENAAYPNTYCAERTALVKAVSEGQRRFTKLAIAGSGSAPYPCGACRQSLYEFAPELEILVAWDGQVIKTSLPELLPCGFGPSSLGK